MVKYELQHQGTDLGTGSFAPVPVEPTEFESGLDYLKDHPYDEFMHNYLLDIGMTFGPNLVRSLMEVAKSEGPYLLALMVELGFLNQRLAEVVSPMDNTEMEKLAGFTPLIYIRWSLEKQRDALRPYWLRMFADSVLRHRPRVPVEDIAHPLPFDRESIRVWERQAVHIAAMAPRCVASTGDPGSAKETYQRATDRLAGMGLRMSPVAKNPASLTPFALQVEWQMEVTVSAGRHDWALAGRMTSYGKGRDMNGARASCFMEVVERVSAFAGFDSEGPVGYEEDASWVVGHRDDLADSYPLLDPNEVLLEVSYGNQVLSWIRGERVTEAGCEPIYVPAQLVFLFCNLDEISLTSGLPSTGLASGNTLEAAKLSALLEVIERDAERLVPYSRDRCFFPDPDAPPLSPIFKDLGEVGSMVRFMDMTSEFGVPCFKAFVEGPNGEILKGCAADLDGTRAMVSALTELPYHPSWFALQSPPGDLPTRGADMIESFSSGNTAQDLALLEDVLMANGYRPIYINLTRKDLGIPVVKAVVPGLELLPEFHSYSPLTFRQFAHYFCR